MSTMLFNFVKITVLAFFLTPEQFGIFGVAIISLDILNFFSNTGFRQALIQKKGEIEPYLNSSWTFGIIRSVVLAIALFFLAPVFAGFFRSPDSVLIIRAISLVFVVRAITNVADLFIEKNLNFKTYFFYQSGGELIDFILSITLAILLKNYWALFFGYLGKSVFKCLLSFIIFPYKPKFELYMPRIKELFLFGKWIFVSSVLTVLSMYLDNIMVGKLIGITALGLYQVAFKFAHTGSGELINIFGGIYFPYFSVLQDDDSGSSKAYLNLLKVNMVVMALIATGMICLSPAFTVLFLKPDWQPIIPVLQILVVASFFNSVIATATPFLRGRGLPRLVMVIQIVKVAPMVIFILLLSGSLGMRGVALSVFMAEILSMIVWLILVARLIPEFFSSLLKIIAPVLLASGATAGIVLVYCWLSHSGVKEFSMVEFFAAVFASILVYGGFLFAYSKFNSSFAEGVSPKFIFQELFNNKNQTKSHDV
jgi:O-antigen/teichoic acid export membrane protein